MKKARKVCQTCQGTGHDKKSFPVVELREHVNRKGEVKRRHTTIKQGSGCMTCLGLGFMD